MASSGAHTEIVLAGLLFSVAVLVTAARVLAVPYPIFLGPGRPRHRLDPGDPEPRAGAGPRPAHLPPPLLYSASFFTGLRELRENVRQISMLAIGLVLATGARGRARRPRGDRRHVVARRLRPRRHRLPHRPVAATAIAGRIGVPAPGRHDRRGRGARSTTRPRSSPTRSRSPPCSRRLHRLEGRRRVSSTPASAAPAFGLAVGWIIAQVRERLNDPPVEITIALFSGYAAYLPAEELGLSGVTAAVAVGLYMGSQTSRLTTPEVRMQGDAVWQIITFLLNSILFLLIGLQLPVILDDLRGANFDTDRPPLVRRRRHGDR
jgi:CPA1 family monovalent cation:H+ antiporter